MKLQASVATFLYHDITDQPASTGFQGGSALDYKHSTASFSDHLDAIANSPLTPKLVRQIDFSLKQKHLLITFDDGGTSAMHAADSIENRGWKGHFFITSGKVGDRGWVSKANIRELHSRGHIVGSHSHSHPDPLFRLPREELVREYAVSIDFLSEVLGEPVIAASLCGGDIGRKTLADFKELGLPYCFTSEITYRPMQLGDTVFLGRFCLKRHTPVKKVGEVADFRSLSLEKLVRVAKQIVKKVAYRNLRRIE